MIRRCVVCSCTDAQACPEGCSWRPGFAAIGIPVCTSCVVTITFPMPGNLGNRRRAHWAQTVKEKHAWQQRALVLEPWLRGRRPPRPLAQAAVQATLILGQQMDMDNAMARLKWVLDLLVRRGWLVDDRPAACRLSVRQLIDRGRAPQIEVTLADVLDPAPATAGGA